MPAHYLPQMYLKRFTDGKRLHVYDRVLKSLRTDVPRNVATISDYYVISDDKGVPDNSVESFLSDIESKCSPVLDALVGCQPITDEQRAICAVFLALMCFRVPAFERAHAALSEGLTKLTMRRLAGTPASAAQLLSRSRTEVSFSPESLSDFVNAGLYKVQPHPNERIGYMLAKVKPLIAAFGGLDWLLLRSDGPARFITGDGPMGFWPLEGAPPTYGEATPGVLKFISLSPTICLMLRDRSANVPILAVKDLGAAYVAEINARIALAALRLVIGRGRGDVENVIKATKLADNNLVPSVGMVEWYDDQSNRSIILSHRVHHDTFIRLHTKSRGRVANAAGLERPFSPSRHRIRRRTHGPTQCGSTYRAPAAVDRRERRRRS
jgi:Protein of unknown function (DUF4238)